MAKERVQRRLAAAVFLVLAPLAAQAQRAESVPRIGFLHQGHGGKAIPVVSGFRQGLREVGYAEGQNITVEYRFAKSPQKPTTSCRARTRLIRI